MARETENPFDLKAFQVPPEPGLYWLSGDANIYTSEKQKISVNGSKSNLVNVTLIFGMFRVISCDRHSNRRSFCSGSTSKASISMDFRMAAHWKLWETSDATMSDSLESKHSNVREGRSPEYVVL